MLFPYVIDIQVDHNSKIKAALAQYAQPMSEKDWNYILTFHKSPLWSFSLLEPIVKRRSKVFSSLYFEGLKGLTAFFLEIKFSWWLVQVCQTQYDLRPEDDIDWS